MSNVYPLRLKDLTPEMVLESCLAYEKDNPHEQLFIIGLRKGFHPTVWASGDDVAKAAIAALALQNVAEIELFGPGEDSE